MQRMFLIHGWTGRPTNDWFPWAKKELEKRGYEVFVPEMPDPDHPKIEEWVQKIKETVGGPRLDDIFVGHSLGCMGVLQYLQTLPENTKIGKLILIAGFQRLTEAAMTEPEKDYAIMDPWYVAPVDYGRIKKMVGSITALFSDNDPWVSYEDNYRVYEENLGAKIILEHGMGHFSQEDKVFNLPILLTLLK